MSATYFESPPPAPLASHAWCVWSNAAGTGGHVERVLPDGCADIITCDEGAPVVADWQMRNATVTHGFTHFDIELALAVAVTDAHHDGDGRWWPIAELDRAGLPTLFAKPEKPWMHMWLRRWRGTFTTRPAARFGSISRAS